METYDGRYGFFILPDLATARRAQLLAMDTVSHPDRTIDMPAVPLFFAPITGMKQQVATGVLARVRTYIGYEFRMQGTKTLGSKAVVWDIVSDDDLRLIQTYCLDALVRHRDHSAEPFQRQDELVLLDDEVRNVAKCGYPFPGRFFIPLAYRRAGFGRETREASHKATIRSIVFAEAGSLCSIRRLIV